MDVYRYNRAWRFIYRYLLIFKVEYVPLVIEYFYYVWRSRYFYACRYLYSFIDIYYFHQGQVPRWNNNHDNNNIWASKRDEALDLDSRVLVGLLWLADAEGGTTAVGGIRPTDNMPEMRGSLNCRAAAQPRLLHWLQVAGLALAAPTEQSLRPDLHGQIMGRAAPESYVEAWV